MPTEASWLASPSNRLDWTQKMLGLCSLSCAAIASVYFVTLVMQELRNDFFWANFADETTQTFVAWQFNTQIWHRTLPFSLFDAAFTPSQLIEIHPAVSRRIIFEQLDMVDYAIRALRTQSIFNTAITYTAHCWLDFNRTLEIAYTTKRLSRCRATEQDNGAVYMESILRNVDWIKWRDSYGPGFQIAYGLALKETRNGRGLACHNVCGAGRHVVRR